MSRFALLVVLVTAAYLWLTPVARPRARRAPIPPPTGPLTFRPEPLPHPMPLPRARAIRAPAPRPRAEEPPASEPPPRPGGWEALRLLGHPLPSRAWDGWRCADLEGEPRQSAWARAETPDDPPLVHEGTCAEWENRPPGEG